MARGGAAQDKLAKLGIRTLSDRVLHLPIRYEDETRLYPIKDAPEGKSVLVEGVIRESKVEFAGKRRILAVRVADSGASLSVRYLHFYPSQVKMLQAGKRVRLFGEIRSGFFGPEMVHPKSRIVGDETPLSASLTPVYPTTAGLSQAALQKAILEALAASDLSDTLPAALLDRLGFWGFAEAIEYLHRPPPDASQLALEERSHPAWRRIKFDELLAQQLSLRLHYRKRRSRRAPVFSSGRQLREALLASLPFGLTAAQRRACSEIDRDLASGSPMQRLLQGDVGSGKTIVAALAALTAIENGYQAAIMAPTEILAEQHYGKFSKWLVPLGIEIAWIAGSLKARERASMLERAASGSSPLVVGTHALFQDQVKFDRLGLVVIDEQHRFGVHQRLALRQKGGEFEPHQLMMSATPIPRTLAMSFYADLDVSSIDELPPGRTPVLTKLVESHRREEVIARVRDICLQGRQAYWVCPLIEESETLQLQTAIETHQMLCEQLPEFRVGLVHGRLPALEKNQTMRRFEANEIQLLVATTVIEVGVDVPNATLMVIEHAERMGLAQLHQLRGRVGRGEGRSTCLLLYQSPLGKIARERLKAIFESNDGFEIARQDLLLRGPGEFLGARQSGVPMLRFAQIEEDADLLEAARDVAVQLIESDSAAVRRHLARWMGEKLDYLQV